MAYNVRGGGIGLRSLNQVREKYRVDWLFHPDAKVDLAMIPFEHRPDYDDLVTIANGISVPVGDISELWDVFFLSFQPEVEPQVQVRPVVRTGTVSVIKDDRTFLIDASAYPGNSGSPVFTKPTSISPDRFVAGGMFLGIVGEYVPYRETAISEQTGRPRIVFEENTGLSRVWSTDFLKEIISSDAFKNRMVALNRIRFGDKVPQANKKRAPGVRLLTEEFSTTPIDRGFAIGISA